MDTVKAKWNGSRRFVAWGEAGHGVVMDATPEYGGDGSGVRPTELVLYGLAGCTAMDVISILEKKRQTVTDLDIVVKGIKRTEVYPKIYERIELEYIVTGVGVKPEAVARAIELSEEKYCSVRGMFGSQVEVVTSYIVREAELPCE
ncbi:MAG: OsmC family protein [Coriobacteriia bacterium]|nr:OsmC family protein [Coriobacteriia bacterium]